MYTYPGAKLCMLASQLRFWEASQRKGYTKAAKSSGGATGPSKNKAAKLLGTPNDRMTSWGWGWGWTGLQSRKLICPLKIDGWNTSFLLGWPISRGKNVSFREGRFVYFSIKLGGTLYLGKVILSECEGKGGSQDPF